MTVDPVRLDPGPPPLNLNSTVIELPSASQSAPSKWNTDRLSQRVLTDIAAAACSSTLVAPLIAMIDRGIIENASQRASLLNSLRTSFLTLLFRPATFFSSRPFRLISLVYFTTYVAANTTDTLISTLHARPASHTTAGAAKFFTTSAANMSLCLYKDSQFARMFGPLTKPGSPAAAIAQRSIPLASYALFALRDSFTVFASFNVPSRLAPLLSLSAEFEKQICSRVTAAQILAPAGAQILSTPLHLLGLDLYNRPKGGGPGELSRWQKVARDWGGSCLARMARVIPAFGIGGVVNSAVRKNLMARVEA